MANRLTTRIQRLEKSTDGGVPDGIVYIQPGESEQAAIERHQRETGCAGPFFIAVDDPLGLKGSRELTDSEWLELYAPPRNGIDDSSLEKNKTPTKTSQNDNMQERPERQGE